eukprot:m.6516 g.6516  ORF g.6516 m.6516 type:complete len:53 (-) comp3544_c0_seq2:49-207(-)
MIYDGNTLQAEEGDGNARQTEVLYGGDTPTRGYGINDTDIIYDDKTIPESML